MNKETVLKKQTEELLEKLNVKGEVSIEITENKYMIRLTSETDASSLIGRYGETLSALQRIIEAMMYKHFNDETEVLVNVNDYRERQKERLEKIAENVALRVQDQKRSVYLRSFSAYERKIMHEYVGTHYPELTSYSEDEGFERKLVIAPKNQDAAQNPQGAVSATKEELDITDLLK